MESVLNGRFCLSALLFQCLLITPGILTAGVCNPLDYHDAQKVINIIDGDTVILGDDRHIRLIGINTPEIDHENDNAEPGALEARNYLGELLGNYPEVYLYYDEQRYDRYKRTLAHIFLPDGSNVQQLILGKGLATPLIIPPNLAFVDCYQQASNTAMEDRKGLWAYPAYAVFETDKINPVQVNKYITVEGKVTSIEQTGPATRIKLAHNLELLINQAQSRFFIDVKLENLVDRQVRARGWLKKRKHGYLIRLNHPADLIIIDED